MTHDGDSTLFVTGTAGALTVTISGDPFSPIPGRTLGTFTPTTAIYANGDTETVSAYPTPSPSDDSVYVVVNRYVHHVSDQSTESAAADVWALPRAGGTARLSWSLDKFEISWMGEAEDGSEFAMAGGHRVGDANGIIGPFNGTVPDCRVRFLSRQQTDARNPSPSFLDDCLPKRGTGSVAPAPQRFSSTQSKGRRH